MNLDETTACHAMLVAHWPSLGGDDELGDVRVTAWYHALRPWAPEVAFAATEQIVTGWEGTFPPRVADWLRTARAVGARLAPRALPDTTVRPEERVNDDWLAALLTPVRSRLSDARGRLAAQEVEPERASSRPEHQAGDMLTYDDLYGTERSDGDG